MLIEFKFGSSSILKGAKTVFCFIIILCMCVFFNLKGGRNDGWKRVFCGSEVRQSRCNLQPEMELLRIIDPFEARIPNNKYNVQ